ncbi:hypothetical protein EI555_010881, partial [Monodon monoceros]
CPFLHPFLAPSTDHPGGRTCHLPSPQHSLLAAACCQLSPRRLWWLMVAMDPVPLGLATSLSKSVTNPAMETIVTAPAVGVTQAGKGGWTPGFPPQAPPLVAQLVPIIRPVNSGPWPHGTSREGSLATNQPYASQ